jgi:hypothetical protein
MATMELASIPRELPQFGRHLSSLARPASEVFGQQGARRGKGSCGCGGKGSCGCGGSDCGCGSKGQAACGSTGISTGHETHPQGTHRPHSHSAGMMSRTGGSMQRTPSECPPDCDAIRRGYNDAISRMQKLELEGDVRQYYQWRLNATMFARNYAASCPTPPCPELPIMDGHPYFAAETPTTRCHPSCYRANFESVLCSMSADPFSVECNRAYDQAYRCANTWSDCPKPIPRSYREPPKRRPRQDPWPEFSPNDVPSKCDHFKRQFDHYCELARSTPPDAERMAERMCALARMQLQKCVASTWPSVPGFDPWKPDEDWCGSGWSGIIVPDWNYCIRYCCYLHDSCYSHGVDRADCDQRMHDCMSQCGSIGLPLIYWIGLRMLGWTAWEDRVE